MPDTDDVHDELRSDHVNIKFNGGDPVINIEGLGYRYPPAAMRLANDIARAANAIIRERRIRMFRPAPATFPSIWEYMRGLAEAGLGDEQFDVEPYCGDLTLEAEALRRQPNLVRFALAVVDAFEQTHSAEADRIRALIERNFQDQRSPP